jgi:CRISPR-associated protein Csd1
MSWIEELYKTYEKCFNLNEINYSDEKTKVPLLPLFHMLKKAHIDVYIDINGNFLNAKTIVNGEYTIIPCTEDSAVRTSGEAPHPLCEKLQYCAKDYADYGGAKNSYYKSYIKQLGSWVNSAYSHYMIEAVYKYLEKGTLVKDLINSQILVTDEKNKLISTWPKNLGKPEVIK